MITSPPTSLTPEQQLVWRDAYRQGFRCAVTGGFQEQNPYELYHPLFDAWRAGWFDSIEQLSEKHLRELHKSLPFPLKNLPSVLNAMWEKTADAARLHASRSRASESETGGTSCG